MATTNNSNSSNSHPATTTTTTAKVRTKARKPSVAERVTASAPLVVPPTPTPTPPRCDAYARDGAGAPGAAGTRRGFWPGVASVAARRRGQLRRRRRPPAPMPRSTHRHRSTIPAVPAGFVPVNAADLLGFRVMASQVAAVPDAIAELQGFTNYTAVFGITAPDVGQLTQRVSVAYQWTLLLSQTVAWYKYAKSQQGMAWKDALELLDTLKPPFNLASTANPALLSQYPATARLLGAKTVVAKRAAASRAKKKAAAAQAAATASAGGAAPAAAAAAQGPAVAAAPPAASGTNGAAETPAAAARIVTVQG